MANETAESTERGERESEERSEAWYSALGSISVRGIVAGVIAGVAMGVLLQFGTGLMSVLGGLVGRSGAAWGWLVHLGVSALYGLAFAVVHSYPPVRDLFGSFAAFVTIGIVYGVSVAAFTIGIVIPFSVAILGLGDVPAIPGPEPGGLLPGVVLGIAHIVYGAVLGAVTAVLLGVRPE